MAKKQIRISGKGSYFGGPNDKMNTGTALGLPDTVRGIALPRHDTLGGYYLMKTQGKTFVTRQVDYGPDKPRTGRDWDITEAEMKHQGLKDPTDTHAELIYLGKNKAKAMAAAAAYGMKGAPAKAAAAPTSPVAATTAANTAAGLPVDQVQQILANNRASGTFLGSLQNASKSLSVGRQPGYDSVFKSLKKKALI